MCNEVILDLHSYDIPRAITNMAKTISAYVQYAQGTCLQNCIVAVGGAISALKSSMNAGF